MNTAAEIDWNFWRARKEVALWEACLLSLSINPEGIKFDPAGWMGGPGGDLRMQERTFDSAEQRKAYDKRLVLLKEHRSDPASFTPALQTQGGDRQTVRLAEFAAWAVQMNFAELPEPLVAIAEKPKPASLGMAPDPSAFAALNHKLAREQADPARRRGGARTPADWSLWADIPKAQLWQAVALSLDVDPGHPGRAPLTVQAVEQGRGAEIFGPEFDRRMTIAQQNLSTSGPLPPEELYTGVLKDPKAVVRLASFRAFAESKGWSLPNGFPANPAPASNAGSMKPVASIATSLNPDEPVKEFTTRERENMLRVIIGLAKAGYGYDPAQKKNAAVAEMMSDLERMGVTITDDTLRKYLKEGVKLV